MTDLGHGGGHSSSSLVGTLVRKKKREKWWVLAVRPEPTVDPASGAVAQPIAQNFCIPRDRKRPSVQDHQSAEESGGKLSSAVPYDFLFLFCKLRVFFREDVQPDAHILVVLHIEFLQCAPDPAAVSLALEGISDGQYSWTVIPALSLLSSLCGKDEEEEEDHRHHEEGDDGNNAMTPSRQVQEILSLPNPSRKRRLTVARIIRSLEKDDPEAAVDKPSRVRPAYIRPKEYILLEQLKQRRESSTSFVSATKEGQDQHRYDWQWMEPEQLDTGNQNNASDLMDFNKTSHQDSHTGLNLPPGAADQQSFRGPHSRAEYMRSKKMPQVRRMVQRVRRLFVNAPAGAGGPRHIVDVGGGRCDLATALAMEFGSEGCVVTVVDKNESSLRAGQAYAQQLGCAHRMNFVCRDMGHMVRTSSSDTTDNDGLSTPTNPFPSMGNESTSTIDGSPLFSQRVDLVVALHACGDLSDLALAFANQLGVPFVVCPCCYTKRYISNFTPLWNQFCPATAETIEDTDQNSPSAGTYLKSLGRLAEIDENAHVSRMARVAINSMRLHGMKVTGEYKHLSLEEYELESSRRNLVLCGY